MDTDPDEVRLLPDAGPLITLAYANALDLLTKPGWQVALVDMVLHEVTRNQTPTSDRIAQWVRAHAIPVKPTQAFARHQQSTSANAPQKLQKNNLGEFAIQEVIHQLALQEPPRPSVLLFEDHRIARSSFLLPAHAMKISTRAFLIFLEQKGWIASASAVEREAVLAGRQFSSLRFPPDAS